MKKRWLITGHPGSGKSFIADIIEGEYNGSRSNQEIRYRERTIEVPGTYLENQWMHNIIITMAQNQAKGMILLLDGVTLESHYSPGFARAFSLPVIGVVTKAEAANKEQQEAAVKKLITAGVRDIVIINKDDGATHEWLLEMIDRKNLEMGGK